MKTAPVRRRGFTLIELLLVIAIIVVLASLTAGTYFRIYASEKVRATNATATKLNTALDRKWTAVLDAAADDASKGTIPQAVLTLAGGDKDRARTIWTYFKLKNELPTTFAEAKGEYCPNTAQYAAGTGPRGIWVWSPQNTSTLATLVLPARSIFAQLPDSGGTPEEQSAACLYLALTAAGNRGNITEGDGLGPQTGDHLIGTANLRVFKDAWDTPIAFSRMSFTGEVNTPEYVRSGAGSRDPCDPNSRLVTFNTSWTATTLNDFWARNVVNHIASGGAPAAYPTSPTQNWLPTVISAGPNKLWDTGLFASDSDNIVSYRLRREGN
jgi:prepilin-type N-terminal cleavage/methylation domain-containing protein